MPVAKPLTWFRVDAHWLNVVLTHIALVTALGLLES